MYVNIDETYLEKNKSKAKKKAIEDFGGEDSKGELLFPELKGDVEIEEFNDGILLCSIDNDLGYFSFELEINDDMAFEIIEYMKSKGEKIKRLVNLVD